MKERPILFSGEMVRAILDGRKTQTRRIVKDAGELTDWGAQIGDWTFEKMAEEFAVLKRLGRDDEGAAMRCALIKCPYGVPGDRLWVRENLVICSEGIEYEADRSLGFDLTSLDDNHPAVDLWNRKAHEDGPDVHPTKIPSIHMPRWASRINLEITNVRVERLQDISEADAKAEGVADIPIAELPKALQQATWSACQSFQRLWDHINGERASWESNPWVWVIEFIPTPKGTK